VILLQKVEATLWLTMLFFARSGSSWYFLVNGVVRRGTFWGMVFELFLINKFC
jgi:hypothetical protein